MPHLSPRTSHLAPRPAAWLHNRNSGRDGVHTVSTNAYCGNNPVGQVDKDGREIYEFDNHGNYIRTIACEEHDIVCIINLDTKEIAYSQQYAVGTISQLETDIKVNSKRPNLQTANLFQVRSAEEANQIFEFVADHTKVEWSIVQDAGKNGVCTNFIGTNCVPKSSNIISVIDHRGYSLDGRCAHSHPNGARIPSESDIDNAHKRELKHLSIQHYTYTSAHGYLPYNGGSCYVGKDGIIHHPKVYEK